MNCDHRCIPHTLNRPVNRRGTNMVLNSSTMMSMIPIGQGATVVLLGNPEIPMHIGIPYCLSPDYLVQLLRKPDEKHLIHPCVRQPWSWHAHPICNPHWTGHTATSFQTSVTYKLCRTFLTGSVDFSLNLLHRTSTIRDPNRAH